MSVFVTPLNTHLTHSAEHSSSWSTVQCTFTVHHVAADNVALCLPTLAPFTLLTPSRELIYVSVNVFQEMIRYFSPIMLMVVTNCYLFSTYMVKIQNKESKWQKVRLGWGKLGLEFAVVLFGHQICYFATMYGE